MAVQSPRKRSEALARGSADEQLVSSARPRLAQPFPDCPGEPGLSTQSPVFAPFRFTRHLSGVLVLDPGPVRLRGK
jgi:hypothetical protein